MDRHKLSNTSSIGRVTQMPTTHGNLLIKYTRRP